MDWAAPDVSSDDAAPPLAGARWSAAPVDPASPRAGLAPMTVSDILDGGFAVLKRAPATIVGLTAAFVVPIQALGAWLNRGADGLDLDAVLAQSDTSFQLGDTGASNGGAWFVLQIGPMIALVFVAAAMARLVSAWHVGHDLTLSELLRGSVSRAWPLLVACVLVHLLEGFSVIGFGVLPLAVMTWFLVTAPVIGAEGLGPIEAMRRSARLVSRRFWRVMGLALLSVLVETLFETALSLLPMVLSYLLGTDGIGWVLPAAVAIFTQLITMPVVAGITVLIYLDLRVRTEGLDLELEAIEAFPVSLLMGLPPTAQDPNAVRDLADQILSEARYDRPAESLPNRVLGWIGDQLARAFGSLVSGGGGTVLAWIIVTAAVAGVVILLVRYGRVTLPALGDPGEPEVMVELTRSAQEWRLEAERLEAEGRWAEGLRCRHRALVADLVRRGAIPEQAGRTAGEYVRDVATTLPDAAAPLAAATELFEAAWYGGATTGAAEAARFAALEARVLAVRAS